VEKGWGSNSPSKPGDGAERPSPEDGLHPVRYDATDSRRDYGSPNGWTSVDTHSGVINGEDWGSVSRFPEGDGWKQT
jgi:hypothetical protein